MKSDPEISVPEIPWIHTTEEVKTTPSKGSSSVSSSFNLSFSFLKVLFSYEGLKKLNVCVHLLIIFIAFNSLRNGGIVQVLSGPHAQFSLQLLIITYIKHE